MKGFIDRKRTERARGAAAAAIFAGLIAYTACAKTPAGPKAAPGKTASVVAIDDEITMGLAVYVKRAMRESQDADAVILRVDTFGGRVDAALRIARTVEGSKVPVYAWVEDKAWSAGALISLAAKRIYMHKSGSIGSAAPVSAGGGQTKALGEKYVSALRAKFRALAERNGYPPELAAAMVDKEHEVVRVRVEGKDRYVTPVTAEQLKKQGKVQDGPEVVCPKGKLLNLSADKAEKYGLARKAESVEEVLKDLGMAGAPHPEVPKANAEKVVNILTSSAATSLLVFLGFMLISAEMHAPGFGWLGVSGVCCFILVFWGHYLAEMTGFIDLFLILLGLFLIALEVFVIPGFGVTGILGFLCLLAGLYLTVVPFVVPSEPWDYERLKDVLWVFAAAGCGGAVGVVSLFYMIARLPMFSRPSLNTAGGAAAPSDRPAPGELYPEQKGLTLSRIAPTGRAQFGTNFIEVRAKSGAIPKGTEIEIVQAGEVPVVRPVRR